MNFFKKLFHSSNTNAEQADSVDKTDPLYIFINGLIGAIKDNLCSIETSECQWEIIYKDNLLTFFVYRVSDGYYHIQLDKVNIPLQNELGKAVDEYLKNKREIEEYRYAELQRRKLLNKISTIK